MSKKIHQTLKNIGLRSSAIALASCLCLSGVPAVAHAAGLGKIVVFSALGQPLRAEIEVSATREELADMKPQLASPAAFKQAGLDYATTLLGIKFSLDKRANGQSIIRLTSDRPINDPFIDMLLELNWPTGRLVREYTFLLDPPEVAAKGSVPVASAVAKPAAPVAKSATPASNQAVSGIDDDVRNKAVAKVRTQNAPAKAVESSPSGGDSRAVKAGDTLRKIAAETKPDGVSLEQMLVGLLRANQDAFDGGNMNRLKAGKILSVPDKATVEAVPSSEAKKIVVAQSADWNAYRGKLAGVAAQSPVKDDSAKQESAGRITAKVEDKAAPTVEPKDQVKVSKTDTATAKSGGATKRSDEEVIAKEKALKEANERLGVLEKNVSDLEKLIELKNQNLAELQKQAAAKQAPTEVKKPAESASPKVEPPPAPAPVATPAKPEPAPAVAEKAAEPVAKVEEPKPEIKAETKVEPPAAAPAAPAKPAEPAPKPKPAVAPPSPPEEPGFFDDLLENPMMLAAGGGVLALLAGLVIARRRRSGKEETALDLSSTLTPQTSNLSANSVFRSTGGQSVDTSSHAPALTDFSQAGPGSIDTDEVDPVAEADVYMAYGRDAQAEEILLEAKIKDPKRYAIHLKLLEIYSNRKDVKQFETVAADLYTETGGVGADWEKAVAMGLKLDPSNPLFGASASASAAFDADATLVVPAQTPRSTVVLPGEVSQMAETATLADAPKLPEPELAPEVVEEDVAVDSEDLTTLDFDLGFGDANAAEEPAGIPADAEQTQLVASTPAEPEALDFDLAFESPASSAPFSEMETQSSPIDFSVPPVSPEEAPAEAESSSDFSVDFDLGTDAAPVPETDSLPAFPTDGGGESPAEDDRLEFDVSLTESTFLGRSVPETSSFDMSSIDLDLNAPEISLPEAGPAVAEAPFTDSPTPVQAEEKPGAAFDIAQVATEVNPDFATDQAETIVNPQFEPEPDLLPEQDFLSQQSETVVNQAFNLDPNAEQVDDFPAEQAETVVNPQFGAQEDLVPEFEISSFEEVTTKLDLAKAYEEMGDFEGARELLQEVLKEGNPTQREKAQAILATIGD